jgi:hypothetical protein
LFEELSQDKKEELVKALTDKDLVKLINEQAADDLADTVGDMPANLAIKVLHAADKDMRADINQILKYKPDTAGAIMTTEYLEFLETARPSAIPSKPSGRSAAKPRPSTPFSSATRNASSSARSTWMTSFSPKKIKTLATS